MLADSDEEASDDHVQQAASEAVVPGPANFDVHNRDVPAAAPKGKSKKKSKQKRKGRGGDRGGGANADDDALLDAMATATTGAVVDGEPTGPLDEVSLTCVLAMSRGNFAASRECRRVFGGLSGASTDLGILGNTGLGVHALDRRGLASRTRGGHEGRLAHHRRLVIIEPTADEPWGRPDGIAEMVASRPREAAEEDGAVRFRIQTTPAHTRARMELLGARLTHDPLQVTDFLYGQPFCVEALLITADILSANGEHDQAFKALRRAVYAVECGFDAGFSPLHQTGAGPLPQWPRVRLELPAVENWSWPGWAWVTALWAYMVGLYRQSLYRTAIEICKLLLAMTFPRDPMYVLHYLDIICIRGRQYDLVRQFAGSLVPASLVKGGATLRLDRCLPNFAFSVALSFYLSSETPPEISHINRVTVTDILSDVLEESGTSLRTEGEESSVAPHAALMRALLFFPPVLPSLLRALDVQTNSLPPADSPYRKKWEQLFECRPFERMGSEFRHKQHFLQHSRLADAYSKYCAYFWRGDAMLCWLHACAGRLVQLSESSLFDSELTAARLAWSQSELGVRTAIEVDYGGFNGSEAGPDKNMPLAVTRSMNHDLESTGVPEWSGIDPVGIAQDDEDAQLERALRVSREAEEAAQRRSLIEEQDAELQESLVADQGREAGAASASLPSSVPHMGELPGSGGEDDATALKSASVAVLVDMGFDASEAALALSRVGNDAAEAITLLTQP
eukprot:TRINITY_DN41031_c0_g1_i1.p1 TRINITY_DN41031_c0_g1~~TRINITY_DN41031_c0_g1_i1.p1  ORF type:complete len:813 (+),score=119.17 TRINITY_DN41031_c0_g1_i1:230-2440(+)